MTKSVFFALLPLSTRFPFFVANFAFGADPLADDFEGLSTTTPLVFTSLPSFMTKRGFALLASESDGLEEVLDGERFEAALGLSSSDDSSSDDEEEAADDEEEEEAEESSSFDEEDSPFDDSFFLGTLAVGVEDFDSSPDDDSLFCEDDAATYSGAFAATGVSSVVIIAEPAGGFFVSSSNLSELSDS